MSTADVTIRPMNLDDWPAVEAIYLEGIGTGNATFEKTAPTREAWNADHLPICRLVAVERNDVVGWIALGAYSSRCVYRGVAELSIYIAERARGRGVGSALLAALIEESERNGIWTLLAGIFPENQASIALHNRHGFRILGLHERLGALDGVWRDVVWMERRSAVVGTDAEA